MVGADISVAAVLVGGALHAQFGALFQWISGVARQAGALCLVSFGAADRVDATHASDAAWTLTQSVDAALVEWAVVVHSTANFESDHKVSMLTNGDKLPSSDLPMHFCFKQIRSNPQSSSERHSGGISDTKQVMVRSFRSFGNFKARKSPLHSTVGFPIKPLGQLHTGTWLDEVHMA